MTENTIPKRSMILQDAKKAVCKDRAETHGNLENNFSTIAKYWSIHTGAEINATDVAVMMGLLKIARIKSNPKHQDNWLDLAGYAACGGEVADKENKGK